MKKYKSLAASTAVILGMSVAPLSHSADSGWYIGASAGQSSIDTVSGGEIDALVTALGGTSTTSVDDDDTGWKLFAGYEINDNFAVEAGYADLGEVSANVNLTAPTTASISADVEATTFYVDVIGMVPVTDAFSAFAKLGFHRWDVEGNASIAGLGSFSADDDGTDVTFGAGVSYAFTDAFSVRGEWDRFDVDGDDVDLLSVGIQFNF